MDTNLDKLSLAIEARVVSSHLSDGLYRLEQINLRHARELPGETPRWIQQLKEIAAGVKEFVSAIRQEAEEELKAQRASTPVSNDPLAGEMLR
jgi:hypothetical protein